MISKDLSNSTSPLLVRKNLKIFLSRCGHNQYGCETNDDCLTAHRCVGEGTNRRCRDINECANNPEASSTYCGANAHCVNQVGWTSNTSFSCSCNSGFHNWAVYTGKIIINKDCSVY